MRGAPMVSRLTARTGWLTRSPCRPDDRVSSSSYDAVSRICHELPVVGMDLVEVSPPYDHAEITAPLGNRVVLEALAGIARRHKDAQDSVTWKRSTPLLQGRGTTRAT